MPSILTQLCGSIGDILRETLVKGFAGVLIASVLGLIGILSMTLTWVVKRRITRIAKVSIAAEIAAHPNTCLKCGSAQGGMKANSQICDSCGWSQQAVIHQKIATEVASFITKLCVGVLVVVAVIAVCAVVFFNATNGNP